MTFMTTKTGVGDVTTPDVTAKVERMVRFTFQVV